MTQSFSHPAGPASEPYPLSRTFVHRVRAEFEAEGYLILRSVLAESEVAAANTALDALDLPDEGDYRPLADAPGPFLDLLDHPRLFPHVLALMGGNVLAMGTSATIISPGAGPMVWHEDGPRPFSYPSIGVRRPLNLLRVGFFLEDLTVPDRGQLLIIPGSHMRAFDTAGPPEGLHNHPDCTMVMVGPGDVVLFHNALWHSTAPHRGDAPRRAIYTAYAPLWHRVVDWVTPPDGLLARIDGLPQPRRALLRQLVGAVPEEAGAPGFFFPEADHCPGLDLITPDAAASGA